MLFHIKSIFVWHFFSKLAAWKWQEIHKYWIFPKQDFEWFHLWWKWEFNLIQTRTKANIYINTVYHHCKRIICTKFRDSKPHNFQRFSGSLWKKKVYGKVYSRKLTGYCEKVIFSWSRILSDLNYLGTGNCDLSYVDNGNLNQFK